MARVKDPNRPKRGFLDGYKTYDPKADGYGDSGDWVRAFNFTMGLDAAKLRMGKLSPCEVLGVIFGTDWTVTEKWKAIKTAYHKLVREYFPEKRKDATGTYVDCGDNEKFLDVQAAYEILESQFGN